MSADRFPSRRIGLAVFVALLLAAAGVAGWLWLPWRSIDGLTVDRAQVVPGPPARIVVDFSVPRDIGDTRRRYGIGFVAVVLSACDNPERQSRRVVDQDGGYLPDQGRASRLPPAGGRVRYRVLFDNPLSWFSNDGKGHDVTARGAGRLCLCLEGSSMFWGLARSATVTLPPLR